MPRAAARFTKADITRALAGAKAAGVAVVVRIAADGDLLILPYVPALDAAPALALPEGSGGETAWQAAMERRKARAGGRR